MINNNYLTLISTSWAMPIAVKIRNSLNEIINNEKKTLLEKGNLDNEEQNTLNQIKIIEERHQKASKIFYGDYPNNFNGGPIYITPVNYIICPDNTHIPMIQESIKNTDTFLVSSFDPSIETQREIKNTPHGKKIDVKAGRSWGTMELADACMVADVKGGRLIGLFPKLKGTRGEHTKGREPNLARVFMRTMASYFDKIISFDVHNEAIAGFVDGGFLEPLYASKVFIDYIRSNLEIDVIGATDEGSVRRATHYSHILNKPMVVALKERDSSKKGIVQNLNLYGDVKGKTVLYAEDILSSGSTLENVITQTLDAGAKKVYVAVTHALFNGNSIERFNNLVRKYPEKLDKFLIIGDSVIHGKTPDFATVVSLYDLMAQAAWSVHTGRSISSLYKDLPENPRLQ